MSRVLRASVAYGLGSILARLVSFVMLPIYTHYVDPAEYAKLQLVLMTVEVLGIAVSAGTTAGFMRFYYKAEDTAHRHQVVFSALLLNLGLNFLGSILLLALARPLAGLVLSSPADAVLFQILAGCFLLEALIGVPLLLMQAEQRAGLFSTATLSRTVLSAALNLLFLIQFGLGVRGILFSTLIAHTLLGVISTAWVLRQTGWAWSAAMARSLRRFGIPYQIATAGSFILTFGDRYVLKASRPLSDVGLYAFGYQFGFLLWSVAAAPFFQTWSPLRYQQLSLPKADRDALYSQGFLYLNLLMVSGAVALTLAVHPALRLLVAPAYLPSAGLVPIVAAAYVVHAWSDAMQFGIDASEQTRYSTYAFWGATIVTVALYFALIPPFGGYGAAIATLLGFLVRFGLTYRFAQRLTHIHYGWNPVLRLLALAGVTGFLGILAARLPVSLQVGAGIVLGALYLYAAWQLVLADRDRLLLAGIAVRAVRRVLPARVASV